jgi:D-arabinose 1-dehydrogenase-like Zn-dependent alcohol dehydrogenase
VLEFIANQHTLPSSYQGLRRAGRLVFIGYTPQLPMQAMPHELVRHEWEILGSRANTKQELQETVELVAQGRIQPLVDRVFPFAEVEAAFEVLRQGGRSGAMCWPSDAVWALDQCQGLCYYSYIAQGAIR